MAEGPSMLGIRDVGFTYRKGGEELFGGLTHTFEPACVTAVTGPSGRGKSTLLYVLGLMLRPARGAVLLDGQRVDDQPDSWRSSIRASRIGFVFQDAALDPTRPIVDSVMEPALYAGERAGRVRRRALELLSELGVEGRADHRPGEVSGGQAQRVAVARALLTEPDVVLADEPTGNLDRSNAVIVLDALRRASSRGSTVVVATHDPFVLQHADRILGL